MDEEPAPVEEASEVTDPPASAPVQQIKSAAPSVPWGIDIKQFGVDYTPLPNGVLVHFTPGVRHPQLGVVPMPPQFTFRFSSEDWERFQAEIAAGGVKQNRPRIATATVLPPPMRQG